ncbi:MAG: porin family protein [Pseudomonadota bacterium]
MKNTLLLAAVALAATFPIAAQAVEGAYIGASVGRTEHKLRLGTISLKDADTGFKFVGGMKVDENIGLEAGLVALGEGQISGNGMFVKAKTNAAYIAGTVFYPASAKVDVSGKLGFTHNRVKATSSLVSGKESTNAVVFGLGVAYSLNKNVALVAEYENFGKLFSEQGLKLKADMFSAGVRYAF